MTAPAKTIEDLNDYRRLIKDNPGKVICFTCQRMAFIDSQDSEPFVSVRVFDNRDKDKQGALEIDYSLCYECFSVIKDRILKKGDTSDIMDKHTCHMLDREAEEEFDTAEE